MKKSAVEWLAQKFEELLIKLDFNEISEEDYLEERKNIIIISKEIEKQNIIDAFKRGIINEMNGIEEITSEQYYNEQFKNK
jgi:hypothetical protein